MIENTQAYHYRPGGEPSAYARACGVTRGSLARDWREILASERDRERRFNRGCQYAPATSCHRLDCLAETIDGWEGARSTMYGHERAHEETAEARRGKERDCRRRARVLSRAGARAEALYFGRSFMQRTTDALLAQSADLFTAAGYQEARANDHHATASRLAIRRMIAAAAA